MPIRKKFLSSFKPDCFYHVYNRTNNKELLFKETFDYVNFKYKIQDFLADYIEIVSYCLLGNHFHFVIKIKKELLIEEHLNYIFKKAKNSLTITQQNYLIKADEYSFNLLIINQFRRFFISYTNQINKKYNRKGSLFACKFKRIAVANSFYLKQLISYVHWNPAKHCIESKIEHYEWSSFFELINDDLFLLNKIELIKIFGNIDTFFKEHNEQSDYKILADIMEEMR